MQVIFAIVVGILLGHFFPHTGEAMKPLGDAFIKIVKMIIAPVIFLTVVTGIAGMTNMKKVGRVAGKSFAYFLTFSTLALLVGMLVANVIQPGSHLNIDPATLDAGKVSTYVDKAKDSSVVGFLMNIIPDTVVSPLVNGNILQVLFVSILFGVSLAMVGDKARPITNLLQELSAPVFRMVAILMNLAPVGAFGAMAFTIGKYGISSIGSLLLLVATFYITSILFVLVVLGAVAKYNGFSIIKLVKYIKDEMWLVLGLVIPTGYSFNLDGTNIYMTMAALFIAQAVGIDLSWGEQFSLLLVAMLSSKGAAGVTGAGFITLAATLSVVPSVPVAGMALILGIDRFMSECRALTNLVGNACATVVVARWENALDAEKLREALDGKPKAS